MANDTGPTSPLSRIDEQTIADTALIVEALAAFAGSPENLETRRERRAWELISTLAEDLRMTPSELLRVEAPVTNAVSDQICAKCGREIGDDEWPWTATGVCSKCIETDANEQAIICEDCYENADTT